jgi:hypothetical protein
MSDSPQLLRAALEYAEQGYQVIPLHTPTGESCSCRKPDCESVGKHPRTAHGLKDASSDPAKIRQWWERWPDANVGIATGPESGIFILDVDGAQGEASLSDLAKRGFILPDTYSVKTGRGSHLYFLWEEDADIRNSQSKLAPGLDIRGAGGYVAAPPSMHKSGRHYEVNESSTNPAPCPEWLLVIRHGQIAQAPQSGPALGSVERLIPKGKGERTPRMVSLAGTMNKRGMSIEAIETALLAENAATCNPPLLEEKVRAIARDIVRRYPVDTPTDKEVIRKPELIRLSEIPTMPVDWLWEPFIPFGMLSMISGDPGAGKSFCALALCADLSRGKLRDGRIVEPATSLYLSVENPLAQTVRPRFDSLGGDASRFFSLKGTLFTEDGEERRGSVTLADISILDSAIVETGARLIVVDPIQSYFGQNVDLHRSNETRPILDDLSKLAEKHGCAVLLLRHLSKQSGGKAITRGLGSIDLSGAVRCEMLAGSLPDDEDVRALCHIKSNIGRLARSIGYEISDQGEFSWTGESPITALELLASPEGPDSKLDEVMEWLSTKLKAGAVEVKDIQRAAKEAGFLPRTLKRAKVALRVCSRKANFGGGWLWSLPADEMESEAGQ